jgi:hypothetical protein
MAITAAKLVAVVLLLFLQTTLGRMMSSTAPTIVVSPQKNARKWSPEAFRMLAAGHLPTAIDWLLIRVMAEGSAVVKVRPGEHSPAFYDIDLATRLDPAFFDLYRYAANFLSVIQDDNAGALLILERGNEWRKTELPKLPASVRERLWRDEWALPVILAYVQLFELKDLPSAARSFREAGQLPNAPGHIRSLAARLEKPGGLYEVGVRLLGFMIPGAPEGPRRTELVRKRAMLRLQQQLWEANEAFESFLQANRVPRTKLEVTRAWEAFRRSARVPDMDPFGGQIGLDPATLKIGTTTPLEKVFGVG